MAGILGITSLPSVASSMTWREFSFVQSVLGWFTLLLSTLHMVFDEWEKLFTSQFVCYLPSNGQVRRCGHYCSLLYELVSVALYGRSCHREKWLIDRLFHDKQETNSILL